MGCGNSRETSIDYSMRYTAKTISYSPKNFDEKMKTITLLLVGNDDSSFGEIKSQLNLKSENQKMIGEMNGMNIETFLRTNDEKELPSSYPDSVIDFVIGVIDEDEVADNIFYYIKSRKLCSHCIIINKTKRTYYDDKVNFLAASDVKDLVTKEINLIKEVNDRYKQDGKDLYKILGENVNRNEFLNSILDRENEIIQKIVVNQNNSRDDNDVILQEHLRFCIAMKSPKNDKNFEICRKRLLIPIIIRRIAYYATETAKEMIDKLKVEEIIKSENLLYIGNRDKTLNGISLKLNTGLGKYFDKVYRSLSLSAKYNFASAILELTCKSIESAASIIKSINSFIEKYQLKELMGENFDRIHFCQNKDKVIFEVYLSEEIYELGQLLIRSIGLEKIKLSFDHLIRITTNLNFKSLNLDSLNFEEFIEMLLKSEISSEFYGDNFPLFAKILIDTFKKCSESYNKVEFWKDMKAKQISALNSIIFVVNTYFSTKFELITDSKTALEFIIGLINFKENKYSSDNDQNAYSKVFSELNNMSSKNSSKIKEEFSEMKRQLNLHEEFSMKNHLDLSFINLKVVVPSLRFFMDFSLVLPEIDQLINKYI